tara:strand:+ start:2780 stop:3112 length:333 start_codon:yes stop_codon:yes gene_type:complete
MINKAELRELRDERGFRKAMDNGDSWTMLTMEVYRTEDENCYYEIEKHEFFTANGETKVSAEWDLLKHGECAWSSEAFEYHLNPIWEELIVEHKADDYFVDDWSEHPELN